MWDRMRRGEHYHSDDAKIIAAQADARRLLDEYNAPGFVDELEARRAVLEQLLGEVGTDVAILPTLRCDYGRHITIGDGTFVNHDCVFLDPADIHIGAHCQIATRVQLLTATHPIDPIARRLGWESAAPIRIGNNVWLGGGVVVTPGVTIGDDTVVGAGAVVTRDLPAGVVAVGTPARVLREITDDDRVDVPPRT